MQLMPQQRPSRQVRTPTQDSGGRRSSGQHDRSQRPGREEANPSRGSALWERRAEASTGKIVAGFESNLPLRAEASCGPAGRIVVYLVIIIKYYCLSFIIYITAQVFGT
jgi:hypothetical protein